MKGTIRLLVGFLMLFGAVGGMDNPQQADYIVEQTALAFLGLALMAWAVRDINREADSAISSMRDWR